jgi:hypothetical protein
LENSLKLGGKVFETTDIIELHYDVDDNFVPFKLVAEAASVGSRAAGHILRHKFIFLMQQYPGREVVIYAEGIGIFSSSFVDEAFARLRVAIERGEIQGEFKFRNLSPINQQLFARSLAQRREVV